MSRLPKRCANCQIPLPARANTDSRGPDIAWMCHCRDCARLVEDSIVIVEARPGGAPIVIWECRSCRSTRACRPGWRTRCPICLDSRTSLATAVVQNLEDHAEAEPAFRALTAETFEIPAGDVTAEQLLMAHSVLWLAQREDELTRPGWTVLASDYAGMPWESPDPSRSHGTWATHEACGTVQKIGMARPECRTCPPAADSRTHRAKKDQPQLLYLVRYLDLLKFGHGDGNRVHAHLNAGCEAIEVLRAPHQQVVAAELRIRRTMRDHIIDPDAWNLPRTFGVGSEVLQETTAFRLKDFLSGPDVTDVTDRWSD